MLLESVDIVSRMSHKFVVSVDVGTTTIRAFVYDENGHIRGRDLDKVRPDHFP
jgi:glycerol kinase